MSFSLKIRSIVKGDKIPVYGTGENIREWIDAQDHAKAILEVLEDDVPAKVYNIPGSKICDNLKIIKTIIKKIESLFPEYKRKSDDYIKFVEDRKGHDFKYELSTKHNLTSIKKQLKFNLESTVKYYVEKYKAS